MNAKGFYLLLYSTGLRTLSLSHIICQIYVNAKGFYLLLSSIASKTLLRSPPSIIRESPTLEQIKSSLHSDILYMLYSNPKLVLPTIIWVLIYMKGNYIYYTLISSLY